MSYCRMGVDGSDVYAWADIDGSYRYWWRKGSFKVDTLQELKDKFNIKNIECKSKDSIILKLEEIIKNMNNE